MIQSSKGERGFSLLEVIIALGILGFIGVAFMTALSTAFSSQDIVRNHVRGENLARAVLEEVRFLTYQPPSAGPYCYTDCYSSSLTVSPTTGYSFTIKTERFCTPEPCTPPDHNIQKNTVSVFRDGKPVLVVSDLKARR